MEISVKIHNNEATLTVRLSNNASLHICTNDSSHSMKESKIHFRI